MAESRRALPNLLGWAGPETVCRCLEQAVRRGPKRTGARTFAQIRAVWERPSFRVGLAADWVRLLRSLPRRPDRCATPTAFRAGPISGGSSAHVSSYVDTACNQHGLQPAVSDYGCPRVKQGQPRGLRANLPEGRSDRILPPQERSSNRPPPACPAGAEVLVARRTAFPRHARPRPARPTGEGVLFATHLAKPPCSSRMDAVVCRVSERRGDGEILALKRLPHRPGEPAGVDRGGVGHPSRRQDSCTSRTSRLG